jgi:SAM-dependent methyltransferase
MADPKPTLDAAYWEDCYRRGDTHWEKGAPSPGLVDFLASHPDLEPASVGVPGCGTGHDVRAWAGAGFDAFGYDIASSAIRAAIAGTGPGLKAQFASADFLHDEPARRFDWLWEHTLFCAIDPADRGRYVQAVLRWLKPDGRFLAVHYLIPDTDGPPFGTTRNELMDRFSPHFELLQEWVPRSYPNRIGLEMMLWWRRKAGV